MSYRAEKAGIAAEAQAKVSDFKLDLILILILKPVF